ncbi:hypothetical protein BGY98DRAFT_215851 [Russula aff. rugulosa BPL654]|nr:hypothetical protein BGY98DRAFT_215851 [Russula aff. rugulosa BPL654]
MSQPGDAISHRAIDPEHGLGERPNTPQPSHDHDQIPQDFSPSDGSESLFSMYLDRVIEEDNKMVESWKGDADGMLVFTGLFSAATATLLSVSISDIRPNSQNTSQPSNPSSTGSSNQTVPFSPSTLSVWANGLWFLSLVISLTCALLATLVQQWARRYQRVAYPRYRPHKRARIHAFYRRGIEKSRIPRAVEALPLLLHIALFVFFAGLSTFLYGVNRTIFKIVTAWMGVCVILYACLSVVPVTRKDSPYSTPLSGAFSFCLTAIRYYSFRNFPSFSKFMRDTLPNLDPGQVHIDDFYSRSMTKTAEEYAFKLNSEIDHDSLLWTFQSLDDDAEFEGFFEGLPRLCDSDTGKKLELKEKYIEPNKEKLSKALIGLMDRT